MKRYLCRIISVILTLCIAIGMLPVTALAGPGGLFIVSSSPTDGAVVPITLSQISVTFNEAPIGSNSEDSASITLTDTDSFNSFAYKSIGALVPQDDIWSLSGNTATIDIPAGFLRYGIVYNVVVSDFYSYNNDDWLSTTQLITFTVENDPSPPTPPPPPPPPPPTYPVVTVQPPTLTVRPNNNTDSLVEVTINDETGGGDVSLTYLGDAREEPLEISMLKDAGFTNTSALTVTLRDVEDMLASYRYAPADTAYTPQIDYKQKYEENLSNTIAAGASIYNNLIWEANQFHVMYVSQRKDAYDYYNNPDFFRYLKQDADKNGETLLDIEDSYFIRAAYTFARDIVSPYQDYLSANAAEALYAVAVDDFADLALIGYYYLQPQERSELGLNVKPLASYGLTDDRLNDYRLNVRYQLPDFSGVPKNGNGLSDEAICVREEFLIQAREAMKDDTLRYMFLAEVDAQRAALRAYVNYFDAAISALYARDPFGSNANPQSDETFITWKSIISVLDFDYFTRSYFSARTGVPVFDLDGDSGGTAAALSAALETTALTVGVTSFFLAAYGGSFPGWAVFAVGMNFGISAGIMVIAPVIAVAGIAVLVWSFIEVGLNPANAAKFYIPLGPKEYRYRDEQRKKAEEEERRMLEQETSKRQYYMSLLESIKYWSKTEIEYDYMLIKYSGKIPPELSPLGSASNNSAGSGYSRDMSGYAKEHGVDLNSYASVYLYFRENAATDYWNAFWMIWHHTIVKRYEQLNPPIDWEALNQKYLINVLEEEHIVFFGTPEYAMLEINYNPAYLKTYPENGMVDMPYHGLTLSVNYPIGLRTDSPLIYLVPYTTNLETMSGGRYRFDGMTSANEISAPPDFSTAKQKIEGYEYDGVTMSVRIPNEMLKPGTDYTIVILYAELRAGQPYPPIAIHFSTRPGVTIYPADMDLSCDYLVRPSSIGKIEQGDALAVLNNVQKGKSSVLIDTVDMPAGQYSIIYKEGGRTATANFYLDDYAAILPDAGSLSTYGGRRFAVREQYPWFKVEYAREAENPEWQEYTGTQPVEGAVNLLTGVLPVTAAGSYVIRLSLGYEAGKPLYVTDKKFTIYDQFSFSQDTYSFTNSASSFGYGGGYKIPDTTYSQVLGGDFVKAAQMTGFFDSNVWAGSCFGLTASAAILYQLSPFRAYPDVQAMFGNIGETRLSSISAPGSPTGAVTQTVETFQIAQLADSVRKARANNTYGTYNNRTYDPTAGMVLTENLGTKQTLNQIIGYAKAVEAGHTPILVDIYGIVPTRVFSDNTIITGMPAGHTLLPYRVDDAGGGNYRVYVYDPNYPQNTACYIDMNPEQGTWAYMMHFSNVIEYIGAGFIQMPSGNTRDLSILWGTSAPQMYGYPFHLIDYVTVDDILTGMSNVNGDYQKQAIVSGYSGVSVEAAGGGSAGIREYIVPGMTADSVLVSPYRMFDLPASGAYTFSFYGDNYSGSDGASACVLDGEKSVSLNTDDSAAIVTLDAKNGAATIMSDENLPVTVSFIDLAARCEIQVAGNASKAANLFVTAGILQIDGLYGDVRINAVNNGQTITAVKKLDGGAVAFDTKNLEQRDPVSVVNPISVVFNDVKPDAWYYSPVMYVYDKGLMLGTSTDPMLFSPNTNLTRGMAVTVLYRMAAVEKNAELTGDNDASNSPLQTPGFSDVAEGAWYADAVNWAARNGIVQGYGDGRFGPNDNLTREQMATILYNYCKLKGIDISVGEDTNILSYQDAFDISEYAVPAFQWACGAGVIAGKPGGYLDPRGTATRAEVATVFMRWLIPLSSLSSPQ